jgi:hypothetical protein
MQSLRLFCRLILALAIPIAAHAQNSQQLILMYPERVFTQEASSPALVTAFHDDAVVMNEARRIQQAWQTDAMSVPWTRVLLDRYIKHKMMPTRGARGLALMHVAMHDAYFLAEEKGADSRIAVSVASSQVLRYLFITEEGYFDRLASALIKLQSNEADSDKQKQAERLGRAVGKTVVEYRE